MIMRVILKKNGLEKSIYLKIIKEDLEPLLKTFKIFQMILSLLFFYVLIVKSNLLSFLFTSNDLMICFIS
jgi:hypothetical protein